MDKTRKQTLHDMLMVLGQMAVVVAVVAVLSTVIVGTYLALWYYWCPLAGLVFLALIAVFAVVGTAYNIARRDER